MSPVGLHDSEWKVEALRLFDRLMAGDHAPIPVDQHRTTSAVLEQGSLERRAPAVGTSVCVLWIRREIGETGLNGFRLHGVAPPRSVAPESRTLPRHDCRQLFPPLSDHPMTKGYAGQFAPAVRESGQGQDDKPGAETDGKPDQGRRDHEVF